LTAGRSFVHADDVLLVVRSSCVYGPTDFEAAKSVFPMRPGVIPHVGVWGLRVIGRVPFLDFVIIGLVLILRVNIQICFFGVSGLLVIVRGIFFCGQIGWHPDETDMARCVRLTDVSEMMS